jgi:phosphatidate cytidylyltransferase
VAGDGGRDRGSEDPFEDFERFFVPIEGVQWPDDPPQESAGGGDGGALPPASTRPPRAKAPPRDRRAPRAQPDPEPTWEMADVEVAQLQRATGVPRRRARAEVVELDEPAEHDRDRLVTVPDDRRRQVRASAGEGSGSGRPPRREAPRETRGSAGTGRAGQRPASEGSSGRRAPAEGKRERPMETVPTAGPSGPPETPPAPPGAGPDPLAEDELTAAWPEPEIDEEPGELTLEDLKKAPPEYDDLPRPPSPGGAAVRTSPAGDPGRGRRIPSSPGDPHVQVYGGGGDTTPSLAEVEAMAENLAHEFRAGPPGEPQDTTDAGPASREPAAYRPPAHAEPQPFDDDLLGEFESPEPPEPTPRSAPRTIKVGAPEDMTGPSWEDPTAGTVSREPSGGTQRPGATERDLPTAVVTAAVLIAAAVLAILFKPWAFAIVVGIVVVIAEAELYAATQRHGYHPATLLGLASGAMVVAGGYFRGEPGMLLMVVLSLIATFIWYMATPARSRRDVIANAGVTMLGILYVGVTATFFVVILTATDSRGLVLAILGLTFLYDVSAFFIGRYWGRRPLAPTISPKKSMEGLIGATVVTLLVGAILPRSFPPFNSEVKLVELGLAIVIFAPLGDLIESLMKRDLGIKDMGSILPGHGGMLDRIDSALLVAPAVFYLIRLIA